MADREGCCCYQFFPPQWRNLGGIFIMIMEVVMSPSMSPSMLPSMDIICSFAFKMAFSSFYLMSYLPTRRREYILIFCLVFVCSFYSFFCFPFSPAPSQLLPLFSLIFPHVAGFSSLLLLSFHLALSAFVILVYFQCVAPLPLDIFPSQGIIK